MLLPQTCFEICARNQPWNSIFYYEILCSPCGSNAQQRLFVGRSVLSLFRLIAASHWCNHTTLLYLRTPWWSQSYLYFQTLHRIKEKKKHHSWFNTFENWHFEEWRRLGMSEHILDHYCSLEGCTNNPTAKSKFQSYFLPEEDYNISDQEKEVEVILSFIWLHEALCLK